MSVKDNVLSALDIRAMTRVMRTYLCDTSIYHNIRERALNGHSYYATSNISPETISTLRILGYTVTEGQGNVSWVVIEW